MATRRRGRGEGSIHRRTSDGRWVGVITFDDSGGPQRRKYVYGKSRKEVAAKLTNVQGRVAQGHAVVDERTLLGALLDDWLAMVKANREHATWEGYEQRVRLHIKPALGKRSLAKLTAADIQRLLDAKRAAGLSPRSVQYIHATLRAALGVAERWGLIARNVAELTEPVTVRRRQVEPFTPDEIQRLLEVCATDRLGAFYVVAMAVGLRPGEALGLSWQDVELDVPNPRVHVRHSLKKGPDGRLVLGEAKTARSRRTIPLPAIGARALKEHRKHQREERMAAGPHWKEQGLVFTTTIGTPVDEAAASRRFSRLQDEAGVPRHRLYDTRHTAASLLLAEGVAPRVVMEVLGHSTYQLTMDTYSHVMPTLLRDAADAMDRAIGPRGV
jgi:integrase